MDGGHPGCGADYCRVDELLAPGCAYALVILWALAGIAAKFPQAGIVTIATWVTFGLVATSLVAAFLVKKNPA